MTPAKPKRARLTASALNDYIFMSFPFGWIAGVVAGTIWAGFHWNDLQREFGRSILAGVTTSQVVTGLLVTFAIRRAFKRGLKPR